MLFGGVGSSARRAGRPVGVVAYVLLAANSAPRSTPTSHRSAAATSQVFAANGTRLGFIQSDVLRSPITTAQMPTVLRDATVAIEDQRFYQNNGVDLTGIFRSAVKDVLHGQALQGASTITMQLMRNLYLGGDTTPSNRRSTRRSWRSNTTNTTASARSSPTTSTASPMARSGARPRSACRRPRGSSSTRPAYQAEPRAGRAARRASRRRPPSTTRSCIPGRRRERRNEVLGKMAELHYITRSASAAAKPSAAGGAPRRLLHPPPGELLLRIRAQRAARTLRPEHRRAGRAEGVHDDRPQDAAPGAQSDRRSAQRARRPRLGDRHDRPRTTATSRRWRSPRATTNPSTTSPPKATASRARPSRRSTSPTRSRTGSTPTRTYYLSHTLAPGWLPGVPRPTK